MTARLVAAIALLGASAPAAAGPYAREARIAHLARALAALDALGEPGRAAFERALYDASRRRCRAGARPAATACAAEVARGACAGEPDPAACTAAADVVLTNQRAAFELVDERTRLRLVRTSTDFHAAVLAEVRATFSLLAAELALAGGDGDLAARIDRFCVERGREVRRCAPDARGCVPDLPWQRCAAGLAWYVAAGTSGGTR